MKKVIHNNKVCSINDFNISIFDRGLTLGSGIFETIMITKKSIPFLDYHWDRLITSGKITGIKIPFSKNELEKTIFELISHNDASAYELGVRLTITEGIAERGILAPDDIEPNFFITLFENVQNNLPWTAIISSVRRNEGSPTSMVKSISYMDNIFAKKEAAEKNANEAILLNNKGHIAEGAISNIFLVSKQGTLLTPRIEDGALPGVTRRTIIDNFSKDEVIEEKTITLNDLINAEEVFLTNALMGIKEITKIDSFFESKSNPKTTSLKNRFANLLKNGIG